MNKKVTKSYITKYVVPIILNKGNIVILGETEKLEKWKGWIRATYENISAWIPMQIIETSNGETGIISEYYSSKELNVNAGESVIQLRELNGWLWVRKSQTGDEGWIPKENTIDNINL